MLIKLTSVRLRLRVYFLPAFSPLMWLSCVSYCHLLTLFGINMLFIKYVVDILSQFRSEENCFIKFVSLVVIDIKSRNTHNHERQPLHVDVQPGSCKVKSIVQLFLKKKTTTFSSKGEVMSVTHFILGCRGFVYATVLLNRRKFTKCFVKFSCFDVTNGCSEDDR